MLKLAIVLTTYKRTEAIRRQIECFLDKRWNQDFFKITVIISDDSPTPEMHELISSLPISRSIDWKYIPRWTRCGQGKNIIKTITENDKYDYYWTLGDDDFLIIEEAIKFLAQLAQHKPAIALVEFRQGESLEFGTFYGFSGLVSEPKKVFYLLANFGKLSSTIFSKPEEWVHYELMKSFMQSMYQDRAYATLVYLSSRGNNLYVHGRTVVIGSHTFGKLSYSWRVFVNLKRTIKLAIQVYNKKNQTDHQFKYIEDSIPILWIKGIYSHFNIKSPISYTRKRLFFELAHPFVRLVTYGKRKKSNFEL